MITQINEKIKYDLIVIGAGSGGVRAARIAANHGAKVAIIESVKVGGTCVLRGCVPKKLLVYGSHVAQEIKDAEGFGWSFHSFKHDWGKLIKSKNLELDRLNKVYLNLLDSSGVEIIYGFAKLLDRNKIAVNKKTFQAKKILISVGGKPFIPNIKGKDLFITSDDALDLKNLPSKIVIYGGGYIALEFACIFSNLGSEVTIVYRGEKILRGFDEDVRDRITLELKNKNINILKNKNIISLNKKKDLITVELDQASKLSVDQVLCATGRIPNTCEMGLESLGVQLGSKGEIIVDKYNATNIKNIFALGDVTDQINLTPVAILEGQRFSDRFFGEKKDFNVMKNVPSAVFSQPAIGVVGLTEEEALKKYKNKGGINIYKTIFKPMKQTMSGGSTKIMMKMIVAKQNDKVIGIHAIGDDMPEIVQLAAVAINAGAKKRDFDSTVGIHPTAAEEIVTMK